MLSKAYDPSGTEDRIYRMWEDSGAFTADPASGKEPFTISMPPPNATGNLHLGHAVMLAIEDILIRFARMRGKEALWVPGTDHAAIATESVVIRQIQREENIPDPRAKLGREELLRRIAEFVSKSQGTIRGQIRKMGASCDWSRERYTLDPALERSVNEVFVKMYRDGLIYRGQRIVNWDPNMRTTVSDDEIEWKEEKAPFFTFQYGPFRISTARPETKFGDKYVVMHPDDERYRAYTHGEKFTCEWINGPVMATVIKDKAVDPAFGTGVMTITPWHDAADFEIAERHGLEKQQIIGYDGKLLPVAGEFAGLPIGEARPQVVEKLKVKGLLVTVEEHYVHNVAMSYRGGGKIEPQIKEQWFIDVGKKVVRWKRRELSLKEVMQDVVRTGQIRIIPERFANVYFHWINTLHDWCISRQVWWGHRIPVWYREDRGKVEMYVGVRPPEDVGNGTEGRGWQQDPDTLDTWFSSALWTWSTLIDPALAKDVTLSVEDLLLQSPDFRRFHPTQVMETGYDILFFWVARMILMTTYATGSIPELEYGHVPFETVYLHGLVRTRDGRKMSKSDPSSIIDPLDMIARYGADALRLSMVVGQSPGADFRLYEEKIAGYRNFVNKLWNASRFVLLECEKAGTDPQSITKLPDPSSLSLADRALLHALELLIADVTDSLMSYRLSEAGERLYGFVWEYFCDWYLELSKGSANLSVLVHALRTLLTLLHPYAPFVTEELWRSLKPESSGMLLTYPWPTVKESLRGEDACQDLQMVIDVIRAVRQLRAEQNVEARREVEVYVYSPLRRDLLMSQAEPIRRLGCLSRLTIEETPKTHADVASAFLHDAEVHLSLAGAIDLEKERVNLKKEQHQLERFLKGIRAKLENKEFLAKAPTDVVQGEREKAESAEEKLRKLEERLRFLRFDT